MHDVDAAHARHPRDRIAEGVILRVADVQIARRVRQHFEHVILRPRIVVVRVIESLAFPAFLPVAFDGSEIVGAGGGALLEHPA
jgi:hypothetical protein